MLKIQEHNVQLGDSSAVWRNRDLWPQHWSEILFKDMERRHTLFIIVWNPHFYRILQNAVHRKPGHVFETHTSGIYVYTHQIIFTQNRPPSEPLGLLETCDRVSAMWVTSCFDSRHMGGEGWENAAFPGCLAASSLVPGDDVGERELNEASSWMLSTAPDINS